MRRDGRCHANRDALRAIGKQVWKRGGQDNWLFLVARIILAKLDRVLVDAFEQEPGDIGHPRFGVAIGGGAVAVDIAEIALAVDQRIARGKILGEADERVVDRLIAMRMERAHHVADDFRAFLEGGARIETQNMHAVEDAPVHRLQPVAGVGQGPPHDGREGIGEVALFERVAQIDGFVPPPVGGGGERFFPMREGLSDAPWQIKFRLVLMGLMHEFDGRDLGLRFAPDAGPSPRLAFGPARFSCLARRNCEHRESDRAFWSDPRPRRVGCRVRPRSPVSSCPRAS